jgi:hypothetical protein
MASDSIRLTPAFATPFVRVYWFEITVTLRR